MNKQSEKLKKAKENSMQMAKPLAQSFLLIIQIFSVRMTRGRQLQGAILEDYDYLSTSDLAGKKIRQNRKRVHVWTLADL